MEFQKACDVALDDGLDLEQTYEDQDPEFFIRSGMKQGVARRFSDIAGWVKQCKESHGAEPLEQNDIVSINIQMARNSSTVTPACLK